MTTEALHLYLIRHGNTFNADEPARQIGIQTDLPLTEKGRTQALTMAKFFSQRNINLANIYCSHLARQKETAHIIATAVNNKLSVHDKISALSELDYGQWEGLTVEEIQQNWHAEYQAWTDQAQWPEAIFIGSADEKINQLALWLNSLRHQYQPGQHVAAVTSNGTIRFFLSLLRDKWKSSIEENRLSEYKVKTGHFCQINLYEDSLDIVCWNQDPSHC